MAIQKLDPVTRIEGHLGVDLDVNGGSVTAAYTSGNLYRGFENILFLRPVQDAIHATQRI
jgi:hydrogenase large subunit